MQKELEWGKKVYLTEGSYGKVYRVPYPRLGQDVAVKVIDKTKIKHPEELNLLKNEIAFMRELKHQNIVLVHQIYEEEKEVKIVMELCESSLRNVLDKREGCKMGEEEAMGLLNQMKEGLSYLVSQNVLHRDIKPDNILVNRGLYKITDFGLATRASMDGSTKMRLGVGTPLYMAPEILNRLAYSSKCDVWSWGITLFECLCGRMPWPARDEKSYLHNIKTVPLRFPYEISLSDEMKSLITQCLVVEEASRIGWKQFLQHPVFSLARSRKGKEPRKLTPEMLEGLKRLSESIYRKKIDLTKIFCEYESKFGRKALDFASFRFMLSKIDQGLSQAEITCLFHAFDTSGDGQVALQEIMELLHNYDFRQKTRPEVIIEEIREVLQANKLDLNKAFHLIDKNHDGSIDQAQFTEFIRLLLPEISLPDIQLAFTVIDKSKDGTISEAELYSCLSSEVKLLSPAQQTEMRAKGIMKSLKQIMLMKGITTKMLLEAYDRDGGGLDPAELKKLLGRVCKEISEEEVAVIFKWLDRDNSGGVTAAELRDFLNTFIK